MNLLADESVDLPIVERLRKDGYSVLYVAEMCPGVTDDVVLQHARDNAALLITLDKDFGELVFRRKLISSGVLLIRLAGFPKEEKAGFVSMALQKHGNELRYSFSVLTPKTIRIRKVELIGE
jgi:predicted nuclease of predicted toxin-antitoxin system